MKHILHIITGLDDGGAEAVLFRLCEARPGEATSVISLGPAGKYSEPLRDLGVEVIHLGMPRGQVTLAGLSQLWHALRARRPGLVQTWMYHSDLLGGTIARLAGCQHVVWNVRHTNLDRASLRSSTRVVARLCAWLSKVVPRIIITCAESAREAHVAFGYDAEKFVTIPNGYDISRFNVDTVARRRVREEIGVDDDVPVLGLVGRWNPQKDHRNFLQAASLLRDCPFRIVLVGTGCDTANVELDAMLNELQLRDRTTLLGRRGDVPSLMNALDLHVLSSYSEAFPNVVAEAMACGTPCVVTAVGDAAAIVGDTGWIVPPRDSNALSRAIAAALGEHRDSAVWAPRQVRARERIVQTFSLEKMIAGYQAVWDRVMASQT